MSIDRIQRMLITTKPMTNKIISANKAPTKNFAGRLPERFDHNFQLAHNVINKVKPANIFNNQEKTFLKSAPSEIFLKKGSNIKILSTHYLHSSSTVNNNYFIIIINNFYNAGTRIRFFPLFSFLLSHGGTGFASIHNPSLASFVVSVYQILLFFPLLLL